MSYEEEDERTSLLRLVARGEELSMKVEKMRPDCSSLTHESSLPPSKKLASWAAQARGPSRDVLTSTEECKASERASEACASGACASRARSRV